MNVGQHHIDFLKGYNGNNFFIKSVAAYYERKGTLSEKQIAAINGFMEKQKPIQQQQKGNAPMARQKAVAPKEESIIDIEEESETSGLFNLEPLEEMEEEKTEPAMNTPNNNGLDTPMLDGIQEMLEGIASQVVQNTMKKAEVKLNAIVAKAEGIAKNKVVMHVKVNTDPVKNLTNEAHELLPKLLVNAKLGENTLLIGPAGSGKTTLGAQVAEALGLSFGHLCLSAGVSETWLYGRQLPTGFTEGEFSKMYRNGGVFLLDEIDAADANLLLTINTALANNELYNPILGEKIPRHKDFVCIAAANTFGLGGNAQYTGRNRLDAATLDRFVQFQFTYNEKLEKKLCPDKELVTKLHKARKKLGERNASQIISTRAIARIRKLVQAGYSEKEAIHTLTVSWPKGLAQEIGLEDAGTAVVGF